MRMKPRRKAHKPVYPQIGVRCTPELKEALRARGEPLGMTMSEYARVVLENDCWPLDFEGLNEVAKSGGH